jgi:hypothetical protein
VSRSDSFAANELFCTNIARRERAVLEESSTASNIVHTHTHKLQVEYQHTHAFIPSASAKVDLPQSLVAAEHLIRFPQPGQLVLNPESQVQSLTQGVPIPTLLTRKCPRNSLIPIRTHAFVTALDLMCLIQDIPDPPALSYKDRLEALVEDWLYGSDLKCNGIDVPLVHWRALYKTSRPNVWAKIKNEWGEWRVSNEPSYSSSFMMSAYTLTSSATLLS